MYIYICIHIYLYVYIHMHLHVNFLTVPRDESLVSFAYTCDACATFLVYIHVLSMRHNLFTYICWMCHMTHLHMCDVFATWLTHINSLYVRHDVFTYICWCATWLIDTHVLYVLYVRHDWFTYTRFICDMAHAHIHAECATQLPHTHPPKDGETALQAPRTEFLRDRLYGYSTNDLPKMNLLIFLVEIS